MDDERKLKITRSQLLDDARKLSRVQMVSDRIYRNHLKTRFFNLQEQRKLTNTIDGLEKQEKDSWRELNHRKLGLERRANKLAETKAINSVAASPLITLRTAGRTRRQHNPAPRNDGRREGRSQIAAPKIWGQERRPSFSSLLNPFMTDSSEYGSKMGYAQHLTKKRYRKSSTYNSPLELEDLQQYNYHQPHFSKSQAVIFRGLKQSAEGLIKMGVIDPSSHTRRTSGLPLPTTIEEEQARYIRTPGQIDENTIPEEEEVVWLPPLNNNRRRSSNASDTNLLRVHGSDRLAYRRGSRSMGALEMQKYLPYVGRSPSPVPGLDTEFSDKLSLFNARMDQLQHRASLDQLPKPPSDAHTAPPPRDPAPIPSLPETFQMETIHGDVTVRGERTRMSVVDRFDLSRWRKDMAEQDTLPVIRSCKYIRNPSRERYDPHSNQYYVIEEDGEEEEEEGMGEISGLPGARLFNLVQEAVRHKRELGGM